MNKFKVAFFDVDNTLYDHFHHCYVQSSIDAIKKAKRKGLKVFIASARPYYSLKAFGLFSLGIRWDGFIASCGANVKVGKKFIKRLLLDKKAVRGLVSSCKKRGLTMELISTYKAHLLSPGNEYEKQYHQQIKEAPVLVRPYRGEDVSTIMLFAPESMDEGLRQENPSFLFYRFHPFAIDVKPEEREKGWAIKDILSYLGLEKENAIAFGDDLQDISMAESCQEFVAVGGAKKEVKEKATYVTSNIEDDGIKKALERFLLI